MRFYFACFAFFLSVYFPITFTNEHDFIINLTAQSPNVKKHKNLKTILV